MMGNPIMGNVLENPITAVRQDDGKIYKGAPCGRFSECDISLNTPNDTVARIDRTN
jgi:hypothetical protein